MYEPLDPAVRAFAAECLDRAQLALELAETNLDRIDSESGAPTSTADLIAAVEARIRLGRAWGELAVQKDTHGDYTRTVS